MKALRLPRSPLGKTFMENIIGVIALIWTAIASIWESWGQVIAWGLAGALVAIVITSWITEAVKSALLHHILDNRRILNRLIERTDAIGRKVDALLRKSDY